MVIVNNNEANKLYYLFYSECAHVRFYRETPYLSLPFNGAPHPEDIIRLAGIPLN